MILVGERLNSTRADVLDALRRRDGKWLLEQARRQEEAGAQFIDLNCAALLDGEIGAVREFVPLLCSGIGVPLSLDSPNALALEAGLRLHPGRPLLNSISGESKKLAALLPLVAEFKPRVIALCLDDAGIPRRPEKSLEIARRLAGLLRDRGLAPEDVFLDPLVRPVGVDPASARQFLDALEMIKTDLPGFRTIAGLSNVSFGMPSRRLLNRTFLVLCLERGLDAAILDPLDEELMDALSSSEALLGREGAVRSFLQRARDRKSPSSRPDRS
ncbi:MAG: methyltetrahydrofolate cobalamin methyltransferase [Candidatus Aminicenantes bacterium]|nr:methyltetrahydrofolate cobalamin methyltransferase [Candidatus Aminicenantes bacterium]